MVKRTTEQQLLLNIDPARYTDTPSSLAVSGIAAQFERSQNVQITPFFTSAGADSNRSFTAVLPQAGALSADRPTISLTPLDDRTRKLFTPLPLDGGDLSRQDDLADINGIPALSGKPQLGAQRPDCERPHAEAGAGGGRLPVRHRRAAASAGSRPDRLRRRGTGGAAGWSAAPECRGQRTRCGGGGEERLRVPRRRQGLQLDAHQEKLAPNPAHRPAERFDSPEVQNFVRAFRLKPGLAQYDITEETLNPFPSTFPARASPASISRRARCCRRCTTYATASTFRPSTLNGGSLR